MATTTVQNDIRTAVSRLLANAGQEGILGIPGAEEAQGVGVTNCKRCYAEAEHRSPTEEKEKVHLKVLKTFYDILTFTNPYNLGSSPLISVLSSILQCNCFNKLDQGPTGDSC